MKTKEEILNDLHDWSIDRFEKEVSQRPDANVHKATLNSVWKQVIQKMIDIKSEQK